MVTSQDCLKKYGPATEKNPWLVLWDVPDTLEIGLIPKRIYCNKDIITPASHAFENLITRNLVDEIKTFDGCFNIRNKRGMGTLSLHAWAIAFDFNAFANPLGWTVDAIRKRGLTPFSEDFLQCFRDAGFDCGGDWKNRPDRMHFQLSKI